ncbi:MAG: zinc-binding dehydrogenase, partial [Deltaproteobacteria bacterium]|nr:zinc-binding dehydrogenase [Deltaproteobacteria bacterium]
MKAIVIEEHGGLDKLLIKDVPAPEVKEGEVLVKVYACGINHLDTWMRRGIEGKAFPLPLIPGSDVSGVVENDGGHGGLKGREVVLSPGFSCGACETCLAGEDVLCRGYGILGESKNGGLAEYIAVNRRHLIKKNPRLSFEEAASIPLTFLTAYHMLVTRGNIRKGETVLVHAGASGVSSAAIQIAKLCGAVVITTAGSREKAEFAMSLGADHAIFYRDEDFATRVKEINNGKMVDMVLDHVGGETFVRSLGIIKPGGRIVFCGTTTGRKVEIDLRRVFFRNISILGSTMGNFNELVKVFELFDKGLLKPTVTKVLPVREVREAHRMMAG